MYIWNLTLPYQVKNRDSLIYFKNIRIEAEIGNSQPNRKEMALD